MQAQLRFHFHTDFCTRTALHMSNASTSSSRCTAGLTKSEKDEAVKAKDALKKSAVNIEPVCRPD